MQTADDSYRPDIDGLRAVAVLAVVVYHAFPQWLPGGYIGVDVFFVISGFLISGQLMASAARGEFSFGDFYARRIRRIFPALIAVLVAVGIVGWWLLLPGEWEELRRHLFASAIFANNFVLWSEAGYFDGPSELKPLLHLWSLGVEEQFYLIWPLLIWLCWKRVRWTTAIALVVAVSFVINVVVVQRGFAPTAFFLPHTRLWQLAAGAYLAAVARDGRYQWRASNAMSIAGILLILLSCAALTRGTAYPGIWALLPTLGALLVLGTGGAFINRALLSNPAMVFVGLISYPLYLWHWPILSFLQITEQGDVSPLMKATAIVMSLVLASLTYRFLELPARRAMTPVSFSRIEPLLAAMVLFGVIAEVAINTDLLTPPARTALEIDRPVRNNLNASLCRQRYPGVGEYCQQFAPELPITTALIGDSHAAHFMPGLGAFLLKSKLETVVHLGHTGCPPLIGIERLNQTGDNTCTRVNRAVIDAVVADRSIREVWLSFRGASSTTGIEDEGDGLQDLFRTSGGTATNEAAIRDGLQTTIKALQSAGKRVGVLLQVPELNFRVDECTGRPFSIAHGPARVPCAVPRDRVMARQSIYRKLIDDMQRGFGIAVYDPIPQLCDDRVCNAVAEGHLLYFDDNHLGVFGSSWALRGFK